MRHLILEIDALGYTKISKQTTPELFNLFNSGFFKSVKTLLGYSSTIAPSIFSGKYPEQHNIFGIYKMSPKTSPFRVPKIFPKCFIDKSLIMRYGVNRLVYRFSKKKVLIPNHTNLLNIPLRLINNFDLSMKKEIYEPNSLEAFPTIFDLIRNKGLSFQYVGYPLNKGSENILKLAEKYIETHDVVYAFIDEIDHNGHTYGVNSKDYFDRLKKFDGICADFLSKIIKKNEPISLTVFSDHGMDNVNGTVNIKEAISESGLELEKDFIYMLDATVARFWTYSDKAKERLCNLLEKTPGGHLLSHDEVKKYKINFQTNENGELFYLANIGNVIMPNFFTVLGSHPKAMHGWDPKHESQNSFVYTNQKLKNTEFVDVTKIFNLLRDTLKV